MHCLKIGCIHGERFSSRAQIREAVFKYIEIDYDRQRRHSSLESISLLAFQGRISA
ncbi:IS3 family transposase [Pseudomonas sp. hsmgli-8]|uniref:IS3 family transposase n=1 Tax=Pseudomonas quercus TaxID=2722792 RepID=A0ABX0YH69_9PSED|nr:IS3 family transposase [Pseudomonas sp. LY10J]NJP02252.1 IS3 family transposase [Pseudomonas quercus]